MPQRLFNIISENSITDATSPATEKGASPDRFTLFAPINSQWFEKKTPEEVSTDTNTLALHNEPMSAVLE